MGRDEQRLAVTPIEVDYREHVSTAMGLLERLGKDAIIPRAKLQFGDLRWATDSASYGVELKSVSDFMGSLWSKETGERLEWQLGGEDGNGGLRSQVDVCILGIHGVLTYVDGYLHLFDELTYNRSKHYVYARELTSTRMQCSSIEGWLASVGMAGVYVIHRSSKEVLLDALASWYSESSKSNPRTFNHHISRGGNSDKGNSNAEYLDILTSIRGIGESVGKALLDRFGTPINVFTAGQDELLQVKDVGPKTVEALRRGCGL